MHFILTCSIILRAGGVKKKLDAYDLLILHFLIRVSDRSGFHRRRRECVDVPMSQRVKLDIRSEKDWEFFDENRHK